MCRPDIFGHKTSGLAETLVKAPVSLEGQKSDTNA